MGASRDTRYVAPSIVSTPFSRHQLVAMSATGRDASLTVTSEEYQCVGRICSIIEVYLAGTHPPLFSSCAVWCGAKLQLVLSVRWCPTNRPRSTASPLIN